MLNNLFLGLESIGVFKLLELWEPERFHFFGRETRLCLKQGFSGFCFCPSRRHGFNAPPYVNFKALIPVLPYFYGGLVILELKSKIGRIDGLDHLL
jgi:hypothetical protein